MVSESSDRLRQPAQVTSPSTPDADVVILGGGLSGLWLAHQLADHASVLLIEPTESLPSPSHTALGIVAAGQAESPARLEKALGSEGAHRLWEWSQYACRSLRLLADELEVPREALPVYRLSLDRREEEELRHSAELIAEWEGVDRVRTLERRELTTVGLRDSFSFGVHLRSDFAFAPGSLVAALEASLQGRVRRGTGNYVITGLRGGQLELHQDGKRLKTEIAVVAGGAGSAAAHPWLRDAIIPVRIHRSSFPGETGPGAQTAIPLAGLCRDRFESWVQRNEGLQFAGCRWAEGPDLGATRKPSAEVLSAVIEAQDSFIKLHLTGNPDWAAGLRDAAVTDFSCDGLPLVGPLPGSPRVLAMCGWNGWGFSAIGSAVAELTAAILGKPAPFSSTQGLLHPRRML